jgi:tetratricopeptide (TPR) repeat protein
LLLAGAAAADEKAGTPPEKLGTVSFANSCSPEVQQSFERAVALLHSFWFKESTSTFRDVLARDPGCAIATWGIASNAITNPFGAGPTPERVAGALEIIAKGRAIGAKTERERGYIEAIAAYWDRFSERPHRARLVSLADAFGALAAKYPDDDETQIFAALYRTTTQSPTDKSFAAALESAAVLEVQFAKHPDHPGVAHYLIHSYDYPAIADKGLAAALCYADIAPSAPHALHMPSHIFTRVGAWKESVATNRRSVAAALPEHDQAGALHAMDYMVYADLQMAQDDDAKRIVGEAKTMTSADPTAAGSPYALAAIPARYAVERGDWAAARTLEPPASRFPFAVAITYFARALGGARGGDAAGAEQDLAELARLVGEEKGAKDAYWATEVEVQRLGASAWIAFAKGDRTTALAQMRAAADMEDASEKAAVTPGRLVPARELLGDMLLESGKPADALAEYEASQVRDPKRFRSLYAAGAAAAKSGNADKARYFYGRLVEMAGSGTARQELVVARAFIAAK